jgi:hypothetical protein
MVSRRLLQRDLILSVIGLERLGTICLTFEPSKVPSLKPRLGDRKIRGSSLSSAASLCDSESEIGVWGRVGPCLAAVDRCMHLKPDVEMLPREKIRSVSRSQSTSWVRRS